MRRSTVAILIVIVLLLGASYGAQPESRAVLWHLRHGFHISGAGLRVRVPLLYEASGASDSLMLMTSSGRMRSRWSGKPSALILMSDKKPPAGAAPIANEQVLQDLVGRANASGATTAERHVQLAGKPVRCVEVTGGLYVGVTIWCAGQDGAIISYGGAASEVHTFYDLLTSAK